MAGALDLRQELNSVESLVHSATEKAKELEGQDRSTIATRIVLLYVISVLLCFAFVLVVFWAYVPCPTARDGISASASGSEACLAWKEPADYLLQVLTTAVLPIVTLVLGYYFGTAKTEGR